MLASAMQAMQVILPSPEPRAQLVDQALIRLLQVIQDVRHALTVFKTAAEVHRQVIAHQGTAPRTLERPAQLALRVRIRMQPITHPVWHAQEAALGAEVRLLASASLGSVVLIMAPRAQLVFRAHIRLM